MDSLIQTFENTELGFNIQSIHINDDMYFKGKDVASTLGYVDTASAIKDHVRQRHKSKLEQIIRASGAVECLPQLTYNEKQTIYITELGLYELALKSKLPALEQFQDWVYDTIKKIRQTGTYTIPQAVPLLEHTGTNPMNLQTENDLHYVVNTF